MRSLASCSCAHIGLLLYVTLFGPLVCCRADGAERGQGRKQQATEAAFGDVWVVTGGVSRKGRESVELSGDFKITSAKELKYGGMMRAEASMARYSRAEKSIEIIKPKWISLWGNLFVPIDSDAMATITNDGKGKFQGRWKIIIGKTSPDQLDQLKRKKCKRKK
jgi:hypothetical protein